MHSDWITGHVSILNAFSAVCINKTNVPHVAYVRCLPRLCDYQTQVYTAGVTAASKCTTLKPLLDAGDTTCSDRRHLNEHCSSPNSLWILCPLHFIHELGHKESLRTWKKEILLFFYFLFDSSWPLWQRKQAMETDGSELLWHRRKLWIVLSKQKSSFTCSPWSEAMCVG